RAQPNAPAAEPAPLRLAYVLRITGRPQAWCARYGLAAGWRRSGRQSFPADPVRGGRESHLAIGAVARPAGLAAGRIAVDDLGDPGRMRDARRQLGREIDQHVDRSRRDDPWAQQY